MKTKILLWTVVLASAIMVGYRLHYSYKTFIEDLSKYEKHR